MRLLLIAGHGATAGYILLIIFLSFDIFFDRLMDGEAPQWIALWGLALSCLSLWFVLQTPLKADSFHARFIEAFKAAKNNDLP